jgi:hypothetical protein
MRFTCFFQRLYGHDCIVPVPAGPTAKPYRFYLSYQPVIAGLVSWL